ncbi:GNAT family N-acetyltransferase [Pelagibacterium sp. H642]|uniref:GNAT family N-acetyltransferase n=1 Tax=Pelagibacterium sp. H642 TaxID=1881069 RepID=UPI0028160E4A|nr:GNAT family N-acetyltransferase [Pelagibacterium sp. H642]WMT90740.1 GNAT family N-acetyltransferase [Pelagibacterium sp. H642]
MDSSVVTLRDASVADAGGIAAVHVAAWKETYTGLVPEGMLAALSVEDREARWRRILADPQAVGTSVCVACDGERIVGFGSCGGQRDAGLRTLGFDAEISALYLLQSHQRQGIGTAMMRRMAAELARRGHAAATLWVLRENHTAQAFYARLGGEVVGEREEVRPEARLMELAYGWRRLGHMK